jgi:hypothetical protein
VFEEHDVSLKGSSLVGQIPNVFGGQTVHVDQDGVKVGLKGLILKENGNKFYCVSCQM